ncbi:MAG TPA: hypothetical protein VG498_03535 [Terriglobales bacterium]|nr:hypothetical protein [Terriglobales bacterium]
MALDCDAIAPELVPVAVVAWVPGFALPLVSPMLGLVVFGVEAALEALVLGVALDVSVPETGAAVELAVEADVFPVCAEPLLALVSPLLLLPLGVVPALAFIVS